MTPRAVRVLECGLPRELTPGQPLEYPMSEHQKPLPAFIPRFHALYERGAPGDCWEWQGSRLPKGYGQFYGGGGAKAGSLYAHRASYAIHVGLIPNGLHVLHRCDNPPCVNPGHLFLGTCADNHRDMINKGRALTRERNPQAKITVEIARRIVAEYDRGDVSQATLGERYGISRHAVGTIVRGDRWGLRAERRSFAQLRGRRTR